MTYTSLSLLIEARYPYSLRIAYLYGNLMNTSRNSRISHAQVRCGKNLGHSGYRALSKTDLTYYDAYDIAFSVES